MSRATLLELRYCLSCNAGRRSAGRQACIRRLTACATQNSYNCYIPVTICALPLDIPFVGNYLP